MIRAVVTPPALLHRFLAIGSTLLAVCFTGITAVGVGPLLPRGDESAPILAYIFAGIGSTLVLVTILVLKPRVPKLRPGQSVEQFWKQPETAQAAMLVWFLLEGASVLSAIGFLLTGEPAVAITMVTAIALLWFNGASAFGKP